MFFVDQVGVKAPGSPRRMTRRPLQRCAKFTSLGPGNETSRPTSGALSPMLANARLLPSSEARRSAVRAIIVRARVQLRVRETALLEGAPEFVCVGRGAAAGRGRDAERGCESLWLLGGGF